MRGWVLGRVVGWMLGRRRADAIVRALSPLLRWLIASLCPRGVTPVLVTTHHATAIGNALVIDLAVVSHRKVARCTIGTTISSSCVRQRFTAVAGGWSTGSNCL